MLSVCEKERDVESVPAVREGAEDLIQPAKGGDVDYTKYRAIDVIAGELLQLPQVDFPLVNRFLPGLYIRERLLPAHTYHVTAIHKEQSPFFIPEGKVSVSYDGANWIHYDAPYYGVTDPGTQRLIIVYEDTIWVTIHPNPENEKDVKKLEARLAKTPDLPPELTGGEIKQLTVI